MTIKPEVYNGETEVLKCALSHSTFEQKAGIRYVTETGEPVSPHAAEVTGVDISEHIVPPDSINTKTGLTEYMMKDLALKRNTKAFSQYYARWSKFYQTF